MIDMYSMLENAVFSKGQLGLDNTILKGPVQPFTHRSSARLAEQDHMITVVSGLSGKSFRSPLLLLVQVGQLTCTKQADGSHA